MAFMADYFNIGFQPMIEMKKKKGDEGSKKWEKKEKVVGMNPKGNTGTFFHHLTSSLSVLFVLIALNLPQQKKQQVSFLQAKGI